MPVICAKALFRSKLQWSLRDGSKATLRNGLLLLLCVGLQDLQILRGTECAMQMLGTNPALNSVHSVPSAAPSRLELGLESCEIHHLRSAFLQILLCSHELDPLFFRDVHLSPRKRPSQLQGAKHMLCKEVPD